jgi:hypothetical protein
MPLPKQQTNWGARIVVLLVVVMAIGLIFPLTWLIRPLHSPAFVVYLLATIWFCLVLLSVLWAISVWAPVRGRKLVDRLVAIDSAPRRLTKPAAGRQAVLQSFLD